MSERPRYYEGEYLRAFDLDAEQSYHLEMRRRLNLALHLWGIVEGLELVMGTDETDGTKGQAYVSPGIAIDAYGREIVVPAKHLLLDDLESNRVTGAGNYSVWISYKRELATIPEGGYRLCNVTDQFTRWQESFEILLTDTALTNPNPPEPEAFDALSDDPEKSKWLIFLGTVSVQPLNPEQEIVNPQNTGRTYIGLRTQHIVSPRDPGAGFNVLTPNTALTPPVSIGVEANLFAEQNVIVGDDFTVNQPDIVPPPQPVFPNPNGNLKVRNDFFLKGTLYTQCDSTDATKWLSLDECIRRCVTNAIPDVQIGSTGEIVFPPSTAANTFAQDFDVTITTALAQIDPAKTRSIASISSIRWNQRQQVNIDLGSTDQLDIKASAQVNLVSGNTYKLTLTCWVGPSHLIAGSSPAGFEIPIAAVSLSYVVIFYPQT